MTGRRGPCIYITDLPRTTPKTTWKWIYRYCRIVLREREKAYMDVYTFGTGYIMYPLDSDPTYIPAERIMIKETR